MARYWSARSKYGQQPLVPLIDIFNDHQMMTCITWQFQVSMATHIAVAHLYQAAPSLGVADYIYEDHETLEGEWYGDRIDTFVSEAELI